MRVLLLASVVVGFAATTLASGCVEENRQAGEPGCDSSAQCDGGICHLGQCLDLAGDEDSDSLTNAVEIELGTDPLAADSDGDGADDAAEVGPDPGSPLDSDGDQVIDALESSVEDRDRDCVVDELDPDELGPPEGTVDAICSLAGICASQRQSLKVICASARSDLAPSWKCDYSEIAGYAERDGVCDGADEDCDGETDEDYESQATFCDAGACTETGTTSCVDGVERDSCERPVTDDDATCDGVDDDCDSETDEDYQPTSTSCGVGPCQAEGVVVCEDGDQVVLCTPEPPLAESDTSCDGVDDDCDGETDEDYVPAVITCGQGACVAEGVRSCVEGDEEEDCEPGTASETDASCDGVDDDCDGETDEDYESTGSSCGVGACAASGVLSCDGGEVSDSCSAGEGALEDADCDGVDDDCDGDTDEDYESRTSECGLGACASTGTTTCGAEGEVDDCQPGDPLSASDASCDGVDDDCDGETDEDYVPEEVTCGEGACMAIGATACVGGQVEEVCTPGTSAPSDATCDGVDDDCDGQTDDDFEPTPLTCGTGACVAEGATVCTIAGEEIEDCDPLEPKTADDSTCNGVDDNCDGQTDEDFPATDITCGVGACEATGEHVCEGGEEVDRCTPKPPAATDATCDGVDDDCNGQTDEDYFVDVTNCGVGECASTGARTCSGGVEHDSCVAKAPNCGARECGSDGCGGSCGTCASNGLNCVLALCGFDQRCTYTVTSGCSIDGACYAHGNVNPANLCEVCNAANPTEWTDAPEDTVCASDSNPCTEDRCNATGRCLHTPVMEYERACDDGDASTLADMCVDGHCVGFEETVEPRFGTGNEVFVIAGRGTHTWGTNAVTTAFDGVSEVWVTRYGAATHGDSTSLGATAFYVGADDRYVTSANQLWEFVDGAWTAQRDAGSLRAEFPGPAEAEDYASYYHLRMGLPGTSSPLTVHALGANLTDSGTILSAAHRRCTSTPDGDGEPTTWTCKMMDEGTLPNDFGEGVTKVGSSIVMASNFGSTTVPTGFRFHTYNTASDSFSLVTELNQEANGNRLNHFHEIATAAGNPTHALGAGSGNVLFWTDLETLVYLDVGAGSSVNWLRIAAFQERMFVLGQDGSETLLASAPVESATNEDAWTVATVFTSAQRTAWKISADSDFLYLVGSQQPGGQSTLAAMWRLRPVPAVSAIAHEGFSGPGLPSGWQVTDFCDVTFPTSWSVVDGYLLNTGNCVEIVNADPSDISRRGNFITRPGTFTGGTIQVAAYPHDNDTFGIVYAVQDDENYYRASFDRQQGFAMLVKFVDNIPSLRAQVGYDYEMDVWYRVEVEHVGGHHKVWIDGELVLSTSDGTFSEGQVGLYTNAMFEVRFDDLRLFPD